MMIVPPLVPASGLYVVVNRSTGACDGATLGAVLAATLGGGATEGATDGAVEVVVPPQAATTMAAPASRPANFRIKAPPGCVRVLNSSPSR